MRNTSLTLFLLFSVQLIAQTTFVYEGKQLCPDSHVWLVDGTKTNSAVTISKNKDEKGSNLDKKGNINEKRELISKKEGNIAQTTFCSLREALLYAEKVQSESPDGTFNEVHPLTIYVAPHVYWLDNPDSPEVVVPKPGSAIPFGLELKVNHLKVIGLSKDPTHTVLACNRGQTQGAVGNFTMLHLTGENISFENLTFGNYCNVDLDYPLDSTLNRSRRADAIVQAQLAICRGDKISARNCHFISRLNSCPLVGARRTFFENCYFECTDDALCGTGVHLNCRFTLFSGKPFYSTQGTGAVFLNCDLHSLSNGKQYLVKSGSPVTMVDCRWTCEDPDLVINWTQDPTDNLRSYQYNLTQNGKPLVIDGARPWLTVRMEEKPVLGAFRLSLPKSLFKPNEQGDTIVYNLRNLLHGGDGWNPANQPDIDALTKRQPINLTLDKREATIETGADTLKLSACRLHFGDKTDFNIPAKEIRWSVDTKDREYVRLEPQTDGSIKVVGNNRDETPKVVNILASDDSGLQGACVLTVLPQQLPAPTFIKKPKLIQKKNTLTVRYTLDLQGREDQSEITWYRRLPSGDLIPVIVSRMNKPERSYTLSAADEGCKIYVSVAPKHLRSPLGLPSSAETKRPIRSKEKCIANLSTDFVNFPTDWQQQLIPGHWTVDAYKPLDTRDYEWGIGRKYTPWYYGEGVDGAAGSWGLMQSIKGSRLLYTPLEGEYSDMALELALDPCKSAGQGFGSATGQYLDVCIKMDTRTLTGYALRIIRTTKHDKAVDFQLMRYENGVVTPISEPVSSICYRKGCIVSLKVEGNELSAQAYNLNPLPEPHREGLVAEVNLSASISPNAYGGIGIQHTGSTGASATVLKQLNVTWKK